MGWKWVVCEVIGLVNIAVYFRMPEELRPKTAQSKKGKKKNKKAMGDLKSTFAELEKKEVRRHSFSIIQYDIRII